MSELKFTFQPPNVREYIEPYLRVKHPNVDWFTCEEFIINALHTLRKIYIYVKESFFDYKSSVMSIRGSEECPNMISKDAIRGRDWKMKFIRNVGKMDLENSEKSRIVILTGM